MGKALVTGAGTGIGRAIALDLARRGYELALVGRRWDPLEEVSEIIRGDGGRCVIIPADVALGEERHKICEAARDELGGLDLLVNNAGVLAAGPLNRLGCEELEQAVATNLTAPIDLTRLFLRDLTRSKGSVVLVASGAAYLPLPSMSIYCATKAGLRAAGEVLRFELRGLGRAPARCLSTIYGHAHDGTTGRHAGNSAAGGRTGGDGPDHHAGSLGGP